MTTLEQREDRMYGALRRPTSPGIGGLRLLPSILALTGLAGVMLLSMAVGYLAAGVLGGIYAMTGIPVIVYVKGRPLYAQWTARAAFAKAARQGVIAYRSGLVSATSTRALPGLLARVTAWSCDNDAAGRPFAMLHYPAAKQWAVILAVQPEGGALVDPDTRDLKVAGWGKLLEVLGQVGGVTQVSATIESQPDSGALLRAHVARMVRPDAPEFAREVMHAAGQELPQGVAATRGYVAITFAETDMTFKDAKTAKVKAGTAAEHIGRLLPDLSRALLAAGAADARPMTYFELTRRINEAYDPTSILPNSEAEAAGEPPALEWADSGPVAAEEERHRYWTDSGVHVTFEAIKVPTGVFTDQVLAGIVGPNIDAPRKRVTFLYHPIDAGQTAELADRDVKTAINRANRRKGPVHAHDDAALEAARQASREEARGAGIAQMSVLATVTVLTGEYDEQTVEELSDAAAALQRACRGRRFKMAPVHGGQAAGFTAALGIGLDLRAHSIVPEALRANI